MKTYTEYELDHIRMDKLNGKTISITELRHLVEMAKREEPTNCEMSDLECVAYDMIQELV